MPELEGQAATQREYMSGATPSDCEETNWHSVGLQKTDFWRRPFHIGGVSAFRDFPTSSFPCLFIYGDRGYARQFIKPPGPPKYSQLEEAQRGIRAKKTKKKKTSAIYCKGMR